MGERSGEIKIVEDCQFVPVVSMLSMVNIYRLTVLTPREVLRDPQFAPLALSLTSRSDDDNLEVRPVNLELGKCLERSRNWGRVGEEAARVLILAGRSNQISNSLGTIS